MSQAGTNADARRLLLRETQMIQRLMTIWQAVSSSLWAVPLTMVCAAATAAIVATRIPLDAGSDPVWWLYSGGAAGAPQFLSNLVSAMITMATLAISITMVVLTLAAQQLGSRLIRSFMSDRQTQISLGLFIATVIYLLLVLRSTYGAGDSAPNLAVTIGTALVFISVMTLPIFVHHLARSIIADNVIERIGAVLDSEIARLLPERSSAPQPARPPGIRKHAPSLRLPSGGYVQAIDYDRLVKLARKSDGMIELDICPGDHAVAGRRIGWIDPAPDEDAQRSLEGAFLLGSERTPIQDLKFSIRQLVEMAVRALSPGINDPFTAIAAIDRLTQSIGRVMERGSAKSLFEDDDGRIRVIAPASTFEEIVDAAFQQLRQHAERTPAVLIRLGENLTKLLEDAHGEQRRALEKHLGLVLNAGERSIADEADLRVLRSRCETVSSSPAAPAGYAARGAALR
jgi:uncharacterized membrane protein